jgi:DNA repair protein RecO
MGEKSEAFIISKEESGDSSFVVTFYCKFHGKIDLFVKSARISKKRFQGKLENGNIYNIEFVKAKKVGSLDSLIGIQIHEDNKFVEFDSDVNIYRSIILETIDKFEIDNQPNENVFNIFKYFNLNIYTKSKAKKIKIIIKSLNQYLKLLGIQPAIKRCYKCKKEMVNIKFFDLKNGGSVCSRCKSKDNSSIIVLKKMINNKKLSNDVNQLEILLLLISRFCEYHSGKIFNSVKYLV